MTKWIIKEGHFVDLRFLSLNTRTPIFDNIVLRLPCQIFSQLFAFLLGVKKKEDERQESLGVQQRIILNQIEEIIQRSIFCKRTSTGSSYYSHNIKMKIWQFHVFKKCLQNCWNYWDACGIRMWAINFIAQITISVWKRVVTMEIVT